MKSPGKQKRTELNLGMESVGNFFQGEVILSADQPFGPYFDSSMVWGR